MLVVSRKIDQSIQIGKDITVCVVDVRGSIVKLGIDAPKEISVVRDDAKPRKVIKSAKEPTTSNGVTDE